MKLFKNYRTLSDYNTDKISISKDNLTYIQNGVTYTADSPEGITSYNTICFINDKKIIKKNDIDYDGVDATRYLRSDEGNIIQTPGKHSYTYIGPVNSYVQSFNNAYTYFRTDIANNTIKLNYFNGSYVSKYLSVNNHPNNPHPLINLQTRIAGANVYAASLRPNNLIIGYTDPNNQKHYSVCTNITADPSSTRAIDIMGTYNYSNLKFVQHFSTNRWPYTLEAVNKSVAYTAYNTSVDSTDPSYTYIAYTASHSQIVMETGFGDGYKGKFFVFGWSNYNDLINGKVADLGASLHPDNVGLTYYTLGSLYLRLGFVRESDIKDTDIKDFTGIYFNDNLMTGKNKGILWTNHTNQELPTACTGTVHIGNEEASNYSYVCPLNDDGTIPMRYVKSLLDKIMTLKEENASIIQRLEALEKGSGTVTEKKIVSFTDDVPSDSSVAVVSGNYGNGTLTLDGQTYTRGIKLESSTSIIVDLKKKSTVTIYCIDGHSSSLKIDNKNYSSDDNFISISLDAGSHTISKNESSHFVMAIVIES